MSKRVKHYFMQSQVGQEVLVVIGQTTHNVTTRMQIWSAGYKVKNIQQLEPEKAISQGAEFIGEFFIFSVAGSLVVWEYDKSKKKEVKKDLGVQNQIVDVRNSLDERLDALEKKLDRLEKSLVVLNESINSNNEAQEQQQQVVENINVVKSRRGWFW